LARGSFFVLLVLGLEHFLFLIHHSRLEEDGRLISSAPGRKVTERRLIDDSVSWVIEVVTKGKF